MKLLSLLVMFSLISCAPLHTHDSALADAGEIAGRILLFPLTLGMSEIGFYSDYQAELQRAAYMKWRSQATEQERLDADRREAVALQALGLALSGGGLMPSSTVRSAPLLRLNCMSRDTGMIVYTDCY